MMMDCASGRGIVHSSLLPTPVVDPIQYQLEQKEIRELPVEHIKKLGDILAEDHQWKDLMSQIPGTKSGGKRFDRCTVFAIFSRAWTRGSRNRGR